MYKLASMPDPITLFFFDLPAKGIISGGTAAAKGTINLTTNTLKWLTAPKERGIPLGDVAYSIGLPLAAVYPAERVSRKMTESSSVRKYHPGYLED